jgi:hypothetical protein
MRVELRIDRLVLEGIDLPAGQHQLVGAHVQAELARLLRDGRLPARIAQGGATAVLAAGEFRLGGGRLGAQQLGNEIGRALYEGIRDG